MKKIILFLFAAATLSIATSCKCHKCTHANLADTKICKEDYNSTQDYNDAVEAAKNWGYKCTPSN